MLKRNQSLTLTLKADKARAAQSSIEAKQTVDDDLNISASIQNEGPLIPHQRLEDLRSSESGSFIIKSQKKRKA